MTSTLTTSLLTTGASGSPGGRRAQALAAGALVGAVVLVLGIGSGLGLVVSEKRVSTVTPASPAAIVAPSVAPSASVAEIPLLSEFPVFAEVPMTAEVPTFGSTFPGPGPAAPPFAAVVADPAPVSKAGPAPVVIQEVAPAAPAPPAAACVATFEPIGPLMKHLQAAHLEESPAQQIADLLDLDQYTLTHTVLVNNMLTGGC
ncbi:MAG: hypothetical protein ACT4OS_00575 [Acidimicrobiales bacterium]